MPLDNYFQMGTTGTAIDLLLELETFLHGAGWVTIDTDVIAATNILRVMRSRLPIYDDQATVIIRADTAANVIVLYGWWGPNNPANPTYTWQYGLPAGTKLTAAGQFAWAPGAYLNPPVSSCAPVSNNYYFFANAYSFTVITNDNTNYYASHGGFIEQINASIDDPYPLIAKGGLSTTASWGAGAGAGCIMFGTGNVRLSYSVCEPRWHAGASVLEAFPFQRGHSSIAAVRPVLAAPAAGLAEIRGYPRGVYRVPQQVAAGGGITLNGQKYLIFDQYAYGPVV